MSTQLSPGTLHALSTSPAAMRSLERLRQIVMVQGHLTAEEQRSGRRVPEFLLDSNDALQAELSRLLRILAESTSGAGSKQALCHDQPRFSVVEVAEALQCSDRWVRQEAASGRLPGEKVGGVWTFTEQDIRDYRRRRR